MNPLSFLFHLLDQVSSVSSSGDASSVGSGASVGSGVGSSVGSAVGFGVFVGFGVEVGVGVGVGVAVGVITESSDWDRVPVRDIQKERLRDEASDRLGVLGAQNANVIDQILIRIDHIQVRDIRFFQS